MMDVLDYLSTAATLGENNIAMTFCLGCFGAFRQSAALATLSSLAAVAAPPD
jgi:hypothetical protein